MKKITFLIFAMILAMGTMFAQVPATNNTQNNNGKAAHVNNDDDEPLFAVVEQMAKFPGGKKALIKYMSNEVHYPQSVIDNNIDGIVVVRFFIEKDGSVSNAQIIQPLDPACDQEALRVINAMPKWKPAKQNGKPVRFIFILPFRFALK